MAEYIRKVEALWAIKDSELGMEYQAVEIIPAADVRKNVHGEWKQVDWTTYECSNCSALWSWEGTQEENEINFCPNCGADMRRENNGTRL